MQVETEKEPLAEVEAFALGFETPVVAFSATMGDSAHVGSVFYSNRILLVILGYDYGDHDDESDVC